MTTKELELQLERLVDAMSLADVITALATIAYEKADHLQSNWQDDAAARTWRQDARKIEKVRMIQN